MRDTRLIFEKSVSGRHTDILPECDVPSSDLSEYISDGYLRAAEPELPEVSEIDAVRHYLGLSHMNYSIESGFYPLGSCTMKYNPKINEDVAALEGFASVHPLQSAETVQGCLQVIYEMDKMLCEITGMDRFTLQPAAGAHGELTGMMMIKAFHERNGDTKRTKMIIPDSAHGTNPASAAAAGFDTVEIKSAENGLVDLEALKAAVDETTAGLMLTNPNTLGLFEKDIKKIAEIVHSAGGLLYYDGANANAILGICRPGDMGFDIVHLNLHKSFSTPHGGGGPGAGPVGVKKELEAFLPSPVVEYSNGKYFTDYDRPMSIGKVKAFYGNFTVAVKAYAYILSLGSDGLRKVSEGAVLNANYLLNKLKGHFMLPYESICMHEFVICGSKQKDKGVSTMDMAKRLMDYGYHPPTVYFPLIVKEAMMIEPTETECVESLDEFASAMISIAAEAESDPDMIKQAPHSTAVARLDEVRAAKNPVLKWSPADK